MIDCTLFGNPQTTIVYFYDGISNEAREWIRNNIGLRRFSPTDLANYYIPFATAKDAAKCYGKFRFDLIILE